MNKLKEFEVSDVVKYVGDNEKQKGKHLILHIDDIALYLNNNYDNAKYFVIDKNNLDKVELV